MANLADVAPNLTQAGVDTRLLQAAVKRALTANSMDAQMAAAAAAAAVKILGAAVSDSAAEAALAAELKEKAEKEEAERKKAEKEKVDKEAARKAEADAEAAEEEAEAKRRAEARAARRREREQEDEKEEEREREALASTSKSSTGGINADALEAAVKEVLSRLNLQTPGGVGSTSPLGSSSRGGMGGFGSPAPTRGLQLGGLALPDTAPPSLSGHLSEQTPGGIAIPLFQQSMGMATSSSVPRTPGPAATPVRGAFASTTTMPRTLPEPQLAANTERPVQALPGMSILSTATAARPQHPASAADRMGNNTLPSAQEPSAASAANPLQRQLEAAEAATALSARAQADVRALLQGKPLPPLASASALAALETQLARRREAEADDESDAEEERRRQRRAESRSAAGGSVPTQDAAQGIKTVPVREVKRAFDAATTSTDGLLPLRRVPILAAALGVPVDRDFLSDQESMQALDPSGDGLVGRQEFLAWWTRHTVNALRKAEEETLKQAAAAAAATAAVVAASAPAPVASAKPVIPLGEALREAADPALEAQRKAFLDRTTGGTPEGSRATSKAVSVVGDDADTASVVSTTTASNVQSSIEQAAIAIASIFSQGNAAGLTDEARAALVAAQKSLTDAAQVSSASQTRRASKAILSSRASVSSRAQKRAVVEPVSGPAPAWLARYGKGPAATDTPVESSSPAPAATKRRPSVQIVKPQAAPQQQQLVFQGRLDLTASPAPSSAQAVTFPSKQALVASAGPSSVDEGTGVGAGSYESPNYVPFPPVLPQELTPAAQTLRAQGPVSNSAFTGGIGLAYKAPRPLLTAEAARFPNLSPMDQEVKSAAAEYGAAPETLMASASGFAPVDLSAAAAAVASADVDEADWNDRFQRLLERPEFRFSHAAAKAVATSSYLGLFASVASEAAAVLVEERGLPPQYRTLPPMDLGGHSTDKDGQRDDVYFYRGVLLRFAESPGSGATELASAAAYASLASSADVVQRKVAGHELRGLRMVQDASVTLFRDWVETAGTPDVRAASGKKRPPPVAVVLTALLDFGGHRIYAMAIPPMDESRTLAFGRIEPGAPFVQKSPVLGAMLKRLGKYMGLKNHSIETLVAAPMDGTATLNGAMFNSARTVSSANGSAAQEANNAGVRVLSIPLSVDTQGHHCSDRRFYVVNACRLCPSDLPGGRNTTSAITCLLRPEIIKAVGTPLSSDAFRAFGEESALSSIGSPSDAQTNDLEAARASQHLVSTVIPAFARSLENLEVDTAESGAFTEALHAVGINARYLGRIAAQCTSAHTREACEIEMVARVAKHMLNKSMRRLSKQVAWATGQAAEQHNIGFVQSPSRAAGALKSHSLVLQKELLTAAADLFNLIIGSGSDSSGFWRNIVVPSVANKFSYNIRLGDEAAAGVFGGASSMGGRSEISRLAQGGNNGCPFHKAQLFFALQHHCGVCFAPDALPLPPALPAIARRLAGTTMDGVQTSLASAIKGVASGAYGVQDPADAAHLYQQVPALAPVAYLPVNTNADGRTLPSTAMTIPGSRVPSATLAAGIGSSELPVSALSAYDFDCPEPLTASDLRPLRPSISSLRPITCGRAHEKVALARSGEEFLAAGEPQDALVAFNLRVALLQCLGEVEGGQHAAAVELCRALLDVARVQLALRDATAAIATTSVILSRISGRHIIAARTLLVRAEALVLAGQDDAALACYGQATEAARWHVGRNHPAVVDLAQAMAETLALAGRHAAAAVLMESATEVCLRALGTQHPSVSARFMVTGDLYRAAAASAQTVVATGLSDSIVLDNVSSVARAHAMVFLNRASAAYDRAILLLDPSNNTATTAIGGGSDNAALVLPATTRDLITKGASALADSLAAQGKLAQAVAPAKRALDLRRATVAPGVFDALLLQCYQQVAAIADRLDRPIEALAALEPLLAILKTLPVDESFPSIDKGLRHVARLTLRSLPMQYRTILQAALAPRLTAATSRFPVAADPVSPAAVAFAARRLWEASKPSLYVRTVAARCLALVSHGQLFSPLTQQLQVLAAAGLQTTFDQPADQPSLGDQLLAIFVAVLDSGEGSEIFSGAVRDEFQRLQPSLRGTL
jgi:hypothetical protein